MVPFTKSNRSHLSASISPILMLVRTAVTIIARHGFGSRLSKFRSWIKKCTWFLRLTFTDLDAVSRVAFEVAVVDRLLQHLRDCDPSAVQRRSGVSLTPQVDGAHPVLAGSTTKRSSFDLYIQTNPRVGPRCVNAHKKPVFA